MVRAHDPPKQFCPECGFELEHDDTARPGHEGELEHYDYYECPNGHGKFQYCHDDKILRKVIG